MSQEEVMRFLRDVNKDHDLRASLEQTADPQAFIQMVNQLGYDFETAELEEVAHEQSEGIITRRPTGVWHWLRTVNWIDRTKATLS